MENGVLDPKQLKANLVEKIRLEVINLIPEDSIIKLVDEVKDEFIKEIKADVKKQLMAVYETVLKEEIEKLRLTSDESYKKMGGIVTTNLQEHIKKAGFDEMSYMMVTASNNAIMKLIQELRNNGIPLRDLNGFY